MSYSITSLTDDYYEGTDCLINKLDIRNKEQLSKIEASITLAKTAELERSPQSTSFDFEHYKQIHKYLFEDLYHWAGEVRTVDISKKVQFLQRPRILNLSQIEKLQLFQK